jgi:type I restriction enzyme S subunit
LLLLSDGYRAKNEELGGDGLIFLRAGHLTDSRIDFDGVERFRTELERKVRAKQSQPGDVMVTTKGNSTGRVGYVSTRLPPFVYSPHLSFWRSLRPGELVPGFLRAWSRGPEFRRQLQALSHGTDMAPYLSLVDQKRLRITLPPPEQQRTIAHVLSALDDKIELNRQMNQTLEQIAAALFRSWFVDFDPVRAKAAGRQPEGMDAETAALFPDRFVESEIGEMPEGWRQVSVSEVADLNARTLSKHDALETIEYIDISSVSRGDIASTQKFGRGDEPSRARRRLRHGDTVLSTVRPDRGAYFLSLNPKPNLIASTGFAVVSPTTVPWSFMHSTLTRQEVSTYLGHVADGGAYPAVRPEVIGNFGLTLPAEPALLDRFHVICGPLFERAALNREESQTLAALRDSLLPRLLSGEIRVPTDGLDEEAVMAQTPSAELVTQSRF